MSKKPIRTEWTTTVDPSEYDYVAQFTRMVKLANRHQECYAPMDVGKVWGLVQSHQRLECENAALCADKERVMELIRLWETQWPTYPNTTEGAYGAAAVRCCIRELRAALDAARKEQP